MAEARWRKASDAELVVDAAGAPALKWKSAGEHLRTRSLPDSTSDPTVLDAFIALAEATPNRVLAFVRKYGMLNTCKKHALPSMHDSSPGRSVYCGALNPEPVAIYTHYARELRSVLRLAADLHRGSVGRPEEWKALTGDDVPRSFRTVKNGRALVSQVLGWWLRYGDVRAVFTWGSDAPQVLLGAASGTWGAVARQLAFAVARAERLAMCAECGRAFSPKRVQSGRAAWCPNCGKRAADRASKRRQRARNDSAKRPTKSRGRTK